MDSHEKFQIAQQRLHEEHDIQYLIEMNRVTRLLLKARFSSRQRPVISFSHKYVITAEDLYLRERSEPKKSKSRRTEEESKELINIFLDGFDTVENEMDRRIYYETTGIELIEGEFSDLETSDEEWKIRNQVDPQELAFSYNQIF